MQLEQWLSKQVVSMKLVNLVLVTINLIMMTSAPYVVKSLAVLPSVDLSAPWAGPFAGAVELYLIYSFPWIAQQLIGISFHATRTAVLLYCETCAYCGSARATVHVATANDPTYPRRSSERLNGVRAHVGKSRSLQTESARCSSRS